MLDDFPVITLVIKFSFFVLSYFNTRYCDRCGYGFRRARKKRHPLIGVLLVYIPTNKDYSVVLSVKEAEEFAELIKRWE